MLIAFNNVPRYSKFLDNVQGVPVLLAFLEFCFPSIYHQSHFMYRVCKAVKLLWHNFIDVYQNIAMCLLRSIRYNVHKVSLL